MVIHCKAEFKKKPYLIQQQRASTATYSLFYHGTAQYILCLKI